MGLGSKILTSKLNFDKVKTKKSQIMRYINDLFWKYIRYPIRYTKHSIKNILRWLPVIWQDRDYDSFFIYEILKIKLKNQSEHIRSHNNHTSAEYDARKMELCVNLIDKLQNSFYSVEYFKFSEIEHVFVPFEGNADLYELKINEISEAYDNYLALHKSAARKVLADPKLQIFKLDDSESKRTLVMNVAHYNEDRARKLLFKIIERHIEGWWD